MVTVVTFLWRWFGLSDRGFVRIGSHGGGLGCGVRAESVGAGVGL